MLQRDVHLPADTQAVWQALTEPDRLAEWFGATVEWDLRVGGRASFRQPDGDREGRVDDVEPGRRLRFRWWPAGEDGEASEVTYRLDADDDGTLLTVTERPVTDHDAGDERSDTAGEAAAVRPGPHEGPMARAQLVTVAAGPGGVVVGGPERWSRLDDDRLGAWASTQAVAVG